MKSSHSEVVRSSNPIIETQILWVVFRRFSVTNMSSKHIYYSEKYYDDEFEYRHVHVPKELVKSMPRDRTMTESEWRGVGIVQSQGWIHYMIHKPEPNVVLFRRPVTTNPK